MLPVSDGGSSTALLAAEDAAASAAVAVAGSVREAATADATLPLPCDEADCWPVISEMLTPGPPSEPLEPNSEPMAFTRKETYVTVTDRVEKSVKNVGTFSVDDIEVKNRQLVVTLNHVVLSVTVVRYPLTRIQRNTESYMGGVLLLPTSERDGGSSRPHGTATVIHNLERP